MEPTRGLEPRTFRLQEGSVIHGWPSAAGQAAHGTVCGVLRARRRRSFAVIVIDRLSMVDVSRAAVTYRPRATAMKRACGGPTSVRDPLSGAFCRNWLRTAALTHGGHSRDYAGPVTAPAAPNGESFEVVVGTDGALTVPAEELARHGVRPGAHLRLVQEPQPPAPRRSARGALAEVINSEELDAFEVALDNSKSERIAAAERRWV